MHENGYSREHRSHKTVFCSGAHRIGVATISGLYDHADEWARGLSRGQYAAVLGASAGSGVLAIGLVLGGEFRLVRALTMALVMFGLEYVFGAFGG